MYSGGFLFGTNIIIAKILVYQTLYNPATIEVPKTGFSTTYNVRHDTT